MKKPQIELFVTEMFQIGLHTWYTIIIVLFTVYSLYIEYQTSCQVDFYAITTGR